MATIDPTLQVVRITTESPEGMPATPPRLVLSAVDEQGDEHRFELVLVRDEATFWLQVKPV
jgi:hypothetical protein